MKRVLVFQNNIHLTEFFLINMGVLTYSLVGICSTFVAAQRIVGRGFRIPLRNGFYIKRWVQPTNHRQCNIIVNQLQDVCRGSIGSLLPHPVLQGKAEELSNKVVLITYNKYNDPVMFNVILIPNNPNHKVLHYGLVMVKEDYKGKKLQNLKQLNMMLMLLSKPSYMYNCFVTSVGKSPTIACSMPTVLENVYPNFIEPENTSKPEYKEIVTHLMDNHRKDTATSSEAELDLKTFVVKRSNVPVGGGAINLVPYSKNRESKDVAVNEFFQKHLDTYDSMFFVGILTPRQAIKNIISLWALLTQIKWTSMPDKTSTALFPPEK